MIRQTLDGETFGGQPRVVEPVGRLLGDEEGLIRHGGHEVAVAINEQIHLLVDRTNGKDLDGAMS